MSSRRRRKRLGPFRLTRTLGKSWNFGRWAKRMNSFSTTSRPENRECGGLLIHPALFVLTPFHLYSTIYEALIRATTPSFAVYSAPRVHQDSLSELRYLRIASL